MPHVVNAVIALVLSTAGTGADTSRFPLPTIVANANEAPGGRPSAGVLTIRLVARRGLWFPEERDGLGFAVEAFGEEGAPLQNPGPTIRVREGTVIRTSIRNDLGGETLVVHGLHTRPGSAADTLQVPPGATREVRFLAGAPGTYFYWGSSSDARSPAQRHGYESQLSGAFVVDPAAGPARADHVFVMSVFEDTLAVAGRHDSVEVVAINGRSFPHTERFAFSVGDSVRWRWINASDREHPMHLHGFYFRVDGRGDAERDTAYAVQQRRMAVTESMRSGATMRIAFAPDRPGNWIFHCHITYHIVPDLHLPRFAGDTVPPPGMMRMAGLVIAFRVRPAPGATAPAPADTQRLRLLVQSHPHVYGGDPGYGYVMQAGGTAPAADSITIPGASIVLTRGRPALITVVNHLSEPTAVHWHGLELQSYYDGIVGMSGGAGRLAPAILPGDSFTAEMTPPRAGTFIYHTHLDDIRQLSLGLYGALLVLEPGQSYDPATDHVVFISLGALGDSAHYLVNGSGQPAPLEFQAGVPQRLRFISMPTAGVGVWSLRRDSTTEVWTPIGKDGADVPPWQRTPGPAQVTISVGETYDFIYTPSAPGPLSLVLQMNGKPRRRVLPVLVR